MHGRLKVKTTAQQEAEKKKERAVKLGGWTILVGVFQFGNCQPEYKQGDSRVSETENCTSGS